jgi:DNA-binding NarL/FixJ family response regulator
VLVQSMHAENQFAIRVLRGGALGYITKDSMPDELVRAVHRVLSGARYVSASLAERSPALSQTIEKGRRTRSSPIVNFRSSGCSRAEWR